MRGCYCDMAVLPSSSRDAVAVELAIERAPREPEQPRGLDPLASGRLQRAEDLLALGGLERELGQARHVRAVARQRPRLEEVRWQVLGQDHAALRDDHRALDHVGEL